jgi:hypothetical protein
MHETLRVTTLVTIIETSSGIMLEPLQVTILVQPLGQVTKT